MRRRLSRSERKQVYEKCSGHCAYCGCALEYENMQVDHKKPLRIGGADELNNMLPSCRSCNHYKATLDIEQFRDYLSGVHQRLLRDSIPYQIAERYRIVRHIDDDITFYFEKYEEVKTKPKDRAKEVPKTYQALDLAKYIVKKCAEDGSPISNLQLQEILYFVQIGFLEKYNRVAFNDEIEPQPYGVRIAEVYYFYCGFGAMSISWPFRATDGYDGIDDTDMLLIDSIVEEKRKLPPYELTREVCSSDLWVETYQSGSKVQKSMPMRPKEKAWCCL